MTLHTQASYPSRRRYVLKLHRDALPDTTKLAGRLENMTSGRVLEFSSGAELIRRLVEDMSSTSWHDEVIQE